MISDYEVEEIKKYTYSVFSSRCEEKEVISDIMLSSDNVFYGYTHFLTDRVGTA